MDKKLIKTLIVIWSVIAIGLIGLLVYGIVNGRGLNSMLVFKHPFSSTLKVQKEDSIEINNLDKLNINFSSSDILIEPTDEPNIKVVQKASGDLDDDQKFVVNKSGNEVTIEKEDLHQFFTLFNWGSLNQRIEVYIPKSYNKDLFAHTSSGDIKCNLDTTLNNIECKATSGNLFIGANMRANEIDLKVSSGNIKVESLASKKYNINTTSGNVDIDSITGSGGIKASSGNIRVSYKDIDEYSEVKATSGNIRMEVPKELSFEFDGECTSGDIKSNFDLNYKGKRGNKATAQIGTAPYKKIDASTSSGNINITK